MPRNPRKDIKEERFNRIFKNFENSLNSNVKSINCNVRVSKKKVPAELVFSDIMLFIKQTSEDKLFDDNFFRFFWSQIEEIRSGIAYTFTIEIRTKDERIVFLEIERKDIAIFNKNLSNFLQIHYETPAMLNLIPKYMNYVKKEKIEKPEVKTESKVVETKVEVEPDSSDDDSDPLFSKLTNKKPKMMLSETRIKSQTFKIQETDSNLEGFNDRFCHTNYKQIRTEQDLKKELGLKIFENTNYMYCNTYPKKWLIPDQMTTEDITKIVKFRTKGRLPILSYIHENGRLLYRSGQISTGLFANRCVHDEMLLYYMGEPLENFSREDYFRYSQTQTKVARKSLKICDARSVAAAYGNKLMGNGFENCEKYYLNCELTFHSIANIKDVKNSYDMIKAFRSTNLKKRKGFLKALGDSKWYEYVSDILEFALEIANMLSKNKHNVLVHCSDGWDRTSQISALVQIILDKKFRTIKGFLGLIEKEFSDAGFNFSVRGGYYNDKPIKYSLDINKGKGISFANLYDGKESPIFIQMLDCVRQIILQKPDYFEFNLEFINELAYCHQLGIFKELFFNSQKIRENSNHGNSMHNYFEEHYSVFINPSFDCNKLNNYKLEFKTDDLYLTLWKELIFENVPYDDTDLIY